MNEADTQGMSQNLLSAHRRAVIIVGAMMSSLFVYTIVVEVIGRTAGFEVLTAPPEILRWVFYAAAVASVFASHVARAFMLRGLRPAGEDELLARLTTAHVVTAAIAEMPAVLGLVLFVLARDRTDFYFLAVLSVYLLLRHFPRLTQWEAMVKKYTAKG